MKQGYKILLWMLPSLMLVGCESATSYSKLLEKEQKLIKDYIARQGIEVLDEFPADSVFAPNQYYHYPEGIYIQLISKGEGEEMKSGRKIVVRFIQSTLDVEPVVESYWTTMDKPYPVEVSYGSITNSCEGWQKAFSVMKRNESYAKFIVPSKLGFDAAAQAVKPLHYEMKIKLKPQ
ncbi:MAG: DUF4827 family protein [Paludibacteraceae bacterium]|jgi:hypothetical protein|nr:DUF4827 family protein [Paludibacteraceae bacterium]MDI9537364.1 DUF4827 family protein [Bacteroidota bacterium]HHT61940.1 DUF4827 domain-containing protein [Bacteroidales bacterium]MBP9039641.1 DUF4827 family protein [Paludibacteraceae bacterium]HOA46671.1 DUF4827 family protein [Paludibacteraceae bacterium]